MNKQVLQVKKYDKVERQGEFNPNELIIVTLELKEELLKTSPYKIKLYRNFTNSIDDLEVNSHLINISYNNLNELLLNDLTQFKRIFIQAGELVDLEDQDNT